MSDTRQRSKHKKYGWTDEERAQVVEMSTRMTVQQIAKEVGRSEWSVYSLLTRQRNGVNLELSASQKDWIRRLIGTCVANCGSVLEAEKSSGIHRTFIYNAMKYEVPDVIQMKTWEKIKRLRG